jgi:hypothetical protein
VYSRCEANLSLVRKKAGAAHIASTVDGGKGLSMMAREKAKNELENRTGEMDSEAEDEEVQQWTEPAQRTGQEGQGTEEDAH